MNEEEKKKIIAVLQEREASRPCPRCGNNSFTLLDGYMNQPVQQELQGMVIGGPSIPTVATACNRCGFVAQHALGILGLMPQKEEPDK